MFVFVNKLHLEFHLSIVTIQSKRLHTCKYYFFSWQKSTVQLLNTELAQKLLILLVNVFSGTGILVKCGIKRENIFGKNIHACSVGFGNSSLTLLRSFSVSVEAMTAPKTLLTSSNSFSLGFWYENSAFDLCPVCSLANLSPSLVF